jgi:hypothetical protein
MLFLVPPAPYRGQIRSQHHIRANDLASRNGVRLIGIARGEKELVQSGTARYSDGDAFVLHSGQGIPN